MFAGPVPSSTDLLTEPGTSVDSRSCRGASGRKWRTGYNDRTEVSVGGLCVTALLDTGATTNAIAEDVVVSILNRALSRGVAVGDEAWPAKFERWRNVRGIRGIVPEQFIEVLGAVVLSVEFGDPGGVRVSQVMRFKILPKRDL